MGWWKWNSFSPRSYHALRPGRPEGEYETIVGRVHQLVELRDKKKAKTKLMVSLIVLPETEDEVKPFQEYWEPKVDRVITRVFTNFGGLVKGKKESGDRSRRHPCLVPWRRMTVNSKGELRYCFNDWCNESVMFDFAAGTSIEEAWNSPGMKKLREDHLALDYKDWPYCRKCTTWSLLRWDYDYGSALKKVLED